MVSGIIALLVGPFQFSNKLRARNLLLHRRIGYTYLTAILVGGTAGIGLALTSKVNITYMLGLFFLAFAWFGTSGMALLCVVRKKIEPH